MLRQFTAYFALIFSVVAVNGCGQRTAPPDSASAPSGWTANEDFLDKLAPPESLGDYTIRPPQGYSRIRNNTTVPGVTYTGWQGTKRPDGVSPSLVVMIGTPPASEVMPSLESFLETALGGIKIRRRNWSQSAAERGTLGGLTFLRATWTAVEPTTNADMKGIVYVAFDGRTVIQLNTQDLRTQEQALALGEASILSFQKQ